VDPVGLSDTLPLWNESSSVRMPGSHPAIPQEQGARAASQRALLRRQLRAGGGYAICRIGTILQAERCLQLERRLAGGVEAAVLGGMSLWGRGRR
jgi:hypothetical protein